VVLQALFVQAVVVQALPPGQTLLHAPQLLGSLETAVSQPSAGLALQSAKPALQDTSVHVPFVQVAVAWAKLQWLPQAPQLLTSVLRLTQVPLQAVWPEGHWLKHWPAWQEVPDAHTLLHAPQLLLSLVRFTQLPVQLVWPVPQVTRHCPPEHAVPEGHCPPQAPQLLLSLLRFTQLPEQMVWPVGQEVVQMPFTQALPEGQAPRWGAWGVSRAGGVR